MSFLTAKNLTNYLRTRIDFAVTVYTSNRDSGLLVWLLPDKKLPPSEYDYIEMKKPRLCGSLSLEGCRKGGAFTIL